MRNWLISLALFCLTAPAFAQDDCPPGHVRHPAISALDDASMLAAYTASFRGIFNREPTLVNGAGVDDGWYYIRQSNHFGVYGDDQCHAGWSGYWESWLRNGHGDLSLVQTAARFQPSVQPPPVPVPPAPLPPPPAPPDQLVFLQSIMNARFDRVDGEIAAVKQDVADFREAVRSKWAAVVKSPLFQIISGAIVTWATTYQVMKH